MRNKFFIGGDQDEKNMTWVKWKRCLASKKHGGLGIGSIFGLNTWLLFKWIWRFFSKPLDLSARVIHSIYGLTGDWEWESTRFWNDTWCGNLPLKWQYPRIYLLDINMNYFISNRVSLLDWHSVLRRYPRGGAEMPYFVALQAAIGNVTLTHQCDSWKWSIDVPAGFSVAPVRALLDIHTLDLDPVATRWNRRIHIKVNVFFVEAEA
ncbi:hypothetical protein Tco_0605649 [Tanacetum coccineum]